jgi:hypothetical protein
MKKLILGIVLLATTTAFSQTATYYSTWLNGINEIIVKDSVHFTVPEELVNEADPAMIKQFVFPLYVEEQAGYTTPTYHIPGKITSNYDYDIVLLCINKKWSDNAYSRKVYLITFSKEGKQLHFEMLSDHTVASEFSSVADALYYTGGKFIVTIKRKAAWIDAKHTREYLINHYGVAVLQSKK